MIRALFCSAILCAAAVAQVNVGSIIGTVSDPSGAAVASATVLLTGEETGVVLRTATNSAGNYLFTTLQPGSYRVAVETPGFKRVERSGIPVKVGDRLAIDFTLEVGAVTESVEVTGEAPLLNTTNANIGQVIDRQRILELPLPGRDTLRLVQLAPGVGGRNSDLGDLRLGGGRTRLVEFYVDGSPTSAAGDARATALPSIDAIQEFKVETNNLSAEYGRLSGGAVNIQTRSGTNELHGSLYDFARNGALEANSWDANRRNNPRGDFNLHQFGFTIGGPVVIPKLYNGRNRTFFFFNYDAERQDQDGSLRFATVPTELERRGDFSQSVNNNGQPVTIYDPYTYNPATNTRSPFPGNIVPENRWDPAARYMLALFPEPNRSGDPRTGLNNFAGINSSTFRRDDITARIDQNFGDNHRVYLRLTRRDNESKPNYWAGPATGGVRPSWQTELGSTFNWTWTVNPTTIVIGQFGATPRDFTYYPVFEGFDPTQVPLAANARGQLDPRFVPNMRFERGAELGVNFQTTWLRERYFNGSLSMTKILGSHTLKIGYEYRPIYLNNTEPSAPAGSASFDGAWTGLNQQAPLAQQGLGFASFLLGLPNSFGFETSQIGWSVAFKNHGLYIQDDWKVNRALTLNLGLRWEYEMPMTERYDRLGFIDYDRPSGVRVNPSWSFPSSVVGAGQLPAGVPSPNMGAVDRIGLGLVNTGGIGRGNTQKVLTNFGPRLGLAWQLRPNTVLRSGFGILYSGYTGNASGASSLSLHPYFRTTGNALITTDNGRTISATLSNPFPNDRGLLFGTNDPEAVQNRSIGGNIFGYQYNHRPSYEISYNFGLQQQVGKWAFESTFIGNRGVHLFVGGNPFVSTMPTQYLSLGPLLETPVANPFYNAGNPENGYQITRPTIPYKTLLGEYPHLAAGSVRVLQRPTGNSNYLAGFFRVERRFANGLSVGAAYTVSKLIEDTSAKTGTVYGLPQDGKTFRDLRGVSVQDIPQKLALSYLYELPVGRGRRLLGNPQSAGERVLNAVAGGWQIAGFTVIQSGYPLQILQSDDFTGGMGYGKLRPTLVGDYKAGASGVRDAVGFPNEAAGRYVNRAAFQVTPRYQFGTTPPVLPDMRQPRWNQTDLAILKKFFFGEARYLEIRAEARNAFNHPVFQLTNNEMNIQNANFGTFQSTANSARNVQIGARFVF